MTQSGLDNIAYNKFANGEITLAEYIKYENRDKNMNYEEKYKQALGWMRSLYKGLHGATKEDAEHYFPELKESEDERIKREILDYINGFANLKDEKIPTEWLEWLEKQGEPEDKGEISDGYHTFNELYSYRMLYNAAFFNLLPKQLVHKSKRHHDGEECFGGGWFIVMANLPTGQISNHYELKDWDLFQIPEKEIADEWDGHTPQEAAERLHKYLLEKQGKQTHSVLGQSEVTKTSDKELEPKMLNADKVIAWLEDQACLGWIEDVEVHIFVDKFKKDFGI